MKLALGLVLMASLLLAPVLVPASAQQASSASERVDPTRPPERILRAVEPVGETSSRGAPRLNLQSIFYSEGRSRAQIDDTMYREGDRVGSWSVIVISPESVELERDNERVLLRVFDFQTLTRSREIE
ncbi:hypothetical protein [Aliidiomarina celeris]|uniref:hypothetical protein n=1 Tax=Aliidiomarina celeris TaxID=2249428 RepID=UPI000DE86E96|nr:hypothetical protein [Aliidiomarina celeris]